MNENGQIPVYTKADITVSTTDLPVADSSYPRIESMVAQLQEKGAPNSVIETLNKNYDRMLEYAYQAGPNGKATFSKDLTNQIKPINDETVNLLNEHGIDVRGLGGNGTNILHYTKADLGERVNCVLNAAIGDDDAGKFIKQKLCESNLKLQDFGEVTSFSREAIAITPRGETDRISRSFYYEIPEIYKDYNTLISAHSESTAVHVQPVITKGISPREAVKLFKELKNGSEKAGNPKLMFYAISNKKEFYFDKDNKPVHRLIYAHYRMGEEAHVVFTNEEEIISYVSRKEFKGKVGSLQDKDFVDAAREFYHETQIDPTSKQDRKLRIITMGKLGSMGFAKNMIAHADAMPDITEVNTLGAGDSYMAAVTSGYMKFGNKDLNPDYMGRLLWRGNALAAEVIQHSQAQIPQDLAKKVLNEIDAQPLKGKNMKLNEDGTWGEKEYWQTFVKDTESIKHGNHGRHYLS